MKSLLVAFALVVVFAATLSAAERHWQGGSYGFWTNKACWAENSVPTSKDIAIFNTDGDVCVNTSSGEYNIYCAGLRVESGDVAFTSAKTMGFQKANCGGTGVVYVAEGSMLCVSNNWGGGEKNDATKRACFRKEGAGVFRSTTNLGYSSASGNWPYPSLEIAEGSVEMMKDGGNLRTSRLIVRDGASLVVSGYNVLSSDYTGIVQVDAGGLLDIKVSGTQSVSGFQGEGRITGVSDGVALTMRMSDEDCLFSGTIEKISVTIPHAATRQFIVASSNALAKVGVFYTSGLALQFAPGVSNCWIKSLQPKDDEATLNTEDTEGNPVRVHVGFGSSTVKVIGGGDLFLTADKTLTGSVVANTGVIGSSGATLTFGDGDPSNDFDFTPFSAVFAEGGAALVLKNADATEIGVPVTVDGTLTVNGPTTFAGQVISGGALTVNSSTEFADLHQASDVSISADTTINGGDSAPDKIYLYSGKLTIGPDARVHGPLDTAYMNKIQTMFTRPRERGVNFFAFGPAASVDIDGGLLAIGNGSNSPKMGPMSIRNGGTLYCIRGMTYDSARGSARTIFLDGGTIRYSFAGAQYNVYLGDSGEVWSASVGEQGGTIDCDFIYSYASSAKYYVYMASKTADGVTRDGGLVFDTPSLTYLYRAQSLNGPVTVRNGRLYVQPGAYTDAVGAAVEAPFGTGDFVLGNAWVIFNAQDTSRTAPLASGAGSKFRVEGASVVSLRESASVEGQSLLIGPSGAEASPFEREKGGVLFVRELGSGAEFDGKNGKIRVNGGLVCAANGRIAAPIFTVQNSSDMSASQLRIDFAKYDDTDGITRFTDYTAGVDGGADSVALVDGRAQGGTVTVEGVKRVAALNVISKSNSFAPLTIAKDAILSVGGGDGTQGCVLLNCDSKYKANISGGGTLDFGKSEGVFAVNLIASYANAPIISAKISGEGGVTFAGMFLQDYPYMTVNGDNDYTGGTVINAVQVRPGHANAFGKGPVRVGGGQIGGGQVYFNTEGLTIANDFSIAGNGVAWNGSPDGGALWFGKTTTLTGDVEIRGYARISSRSETSTASAGGMGTFRGIISGGRLQIVACAQPMVFEGENTYSGGTEVLSSTLILRGSGTVGTGTVTLDNGVLRFENDVPVVFTNKLEGVGRIEVAGSAPVTFAGEGFDTLPVRTLYPGSSVGFPDCANATYDFGADFDIDLGGRDITVVGLSGSGSIRGGTVSVMGTVNPGGENAIGTITFGLPPVLSGATLVIETENGDVDKVVVPGDADVSSVNLRVAQIGRRVDVKGVMFSCGGELSGPFATIERPAKKSDLYEIGYTEGDATLDYICPGMSIIVR